METCAEYGDPVGIQYNIFIATVRFADSKWTQLASGNCFYSFFR